MKELFIAAHQGLVEQYLLDNPGTDWSEAYEKTADCAYGRYRNKFADMADAAKQRAKNEGNWPPKANASASPNE